MLTHRGAQTIETERLLLRPFTMDNAEAMLRNWAILKESLDASAPKDFSTR